MAEYAFRSKKNMFILRNIYTDVRKNLLKAYIRCIEWRMVLRHGYKVKQNKIES